VDYFSESLLIDVFEFGRYYGRQWKIVLSIFLVCITAGVVYFLTTTSVYRAQVTLQFQAAPDPSNSVGSTLGIGLALMGLQGDKALPERAKGFGILKSRAFLLPFIQKMHLVSDLFPNRFDESGSTLKHGKKPPTADELHEEFLTRAMAIDDNTSTGLITISIFLPTAHGAEIVANTLIADLNEKLRLDTITQANANLEYLNQRLTTNQVAEIRVAIAQLVQNEMKRILLASGQTTQSFRVLDPAIQPERRYAPRVLLVSAFALLSAAMLSFFVVVIRFLADSHKR